jgi:methylase of polypeptide subunit release factors
MDTRAHMANLDHKTIEGFGDEWSRFDQSALSPSERDAIFADYFGIFPWDILPADAQGFDMGCGSGRWAELVAPRVGVLHCVDPSSAIEIAKSNLKQFNNVEFHHTDLDKSISLTTRWTLDIRLVYFITYQTRDLR